VAMSDHASMVVLPSLLASVRRTATHIKMEVFPSGAENLWGCRGGTNRYVSLPGRSFVPAIFAIAQTGLILTVPRGWQR
jgi:hypothetical protein